jgi:PadR family transcriptional regulator, regulatory protein PadR
MPGAAAGAASCEGACHPAAATRLDGMASPSTIPNREMYSLAMQAETDARIGRDLVAASAMPLVLSILAEGQTYGYAILKQIHELSGGELEWSDGMLYPLLHLERLGYVEANWGPGQGERRRRYYSITPAGRSALSEQRRQWEVVSTALHNAWHSLQFAGAPLRTGDAAT